MTCTRKRLSAYTDEFNILVKLDELALADPADANIVFKFKSEANRVVHFFRWEFQSIWSSTIDEYSDSYSMIKGTMIPQSLYGNNLNISTAFRGPDPTVITFELTPTYYSDEINSANLEGYRVHHRSFKRGSYINERTLNNLYNYDGRYSEDFSIKFETILSSNVYNVRVIRLRSVIDIATQILGLLAGLAFICRFMKFILMRFNVWEHLDREYNLYYKDDNRMSVILNDPVEKKEIERNSDFWDSHYPYSNRHVSRDEDGDPVVSKQATDGFGAMRRSHTKHHDNRLDVPETDMTPYKFQKFDDEEDPKEDHKESREEDPNKVKNK
jgi:hypothetical protein